MSVVLHSWALEYDNVSCEFSVERRLLRRRKKRRMNRVFRFENIKKSCWYRYFTRPGMTREITHELSSSDRFGEFRHWFRMPLSKVEDLTNILIDHGYIIPPRSQRAFGVVGDVCALYIGIGSNISLLQTNVWHIHVGGKNVFLHIH